MPRTFVIGDIHGAHRALKQCLERADFDYEHDHLIALGDVVDGWPETPECVEELIHIKNLTLLIGNHDQWCIDWMTHGQRPLIWTEQGGQATIDAYVRRGDLIAKHRDEFWSKGVYRYLDSRNRLFVHGGVDPSISLEKNKPRYLMWDRALAMRAVNKKTVQPWRKWDEIYIGHTSVHSISPQPINHEHVWLMDTGGGWEGVLSMMNVDTKELYQSDLVADLYPNVKGR